MNSLTEGKEYNQVTEDEGYIHNYCSRMKNNVRFSKEIGARESSETSEKVHLIRKRG